MNETTRIPHMAPGEDRALVLREKERIRREARAIVLETTKHPRKHLPENYEWAHDLRRARTYILGGLFRLFDVMQRRGMGQRGRMLALQLLALAHEYVDMVLPGLPAPTPSAEPVPLRLVKFDREPDADIRRAA